MPVKGVFDVFDEYGLEFINFKGIMDITYNDDCYNDAIVLYEEKNKNPFYNDLSDRNDFPYYDFRDYSTTPT